MKNINQNSNVLEQLQDTIKDNPTKGIVLLGNAGVGKTTALNQFMANEYGTEQSKLMYNDYYSIKRDFLRSQSNELFGWKADYPMFIDDIGIEDGVINVYGTQTNPILELIHQRYDNYVKRLIKTYFASNLSEQQLREKYGDRILSRLNEMCIFVELTGKDYRYEQ